MEIYLDISDFWLVLKLTMFPLLKGQLISKVLFGAIIWTLNLDHKNQQDFFKPLKSVQIKKPLLYNYIK